nr:hypothetical protein KPHV_71340 [Kitasatospora purpeofusca]
MDRPMVADRAAPPGSGASAGCAQAGFGVPEQGFRGIDALWPAYRRGGAQTRATTRAWRRAPPPAGPAPGPLAAPVPTGARWCERPPREHCPDRPERARGAPTPGGVACTTSGMWS